MEIPPDQRPDDIPEYVLLSCRDAYHPNVNVKTTTTAIHQLIASVRKDIMRNKKAETKLFIEISRGLRNTDANKRYIEGGNSWRTFCDDVILFYVYRFILFNKQMPASKDKDLIEANDKLNELKDKAIEERKKEILEGLDKK